jgi:hypothetical protein
MATFGGKKSAIWKYFNKELGTEANSKVLCKICEAKISFAYSSTSSMIKHLKSKHIQEYQKFAAFKVPRKAQQTLASSSSKPQGKLEDFVAISSSKKVQ